MARKNNSEIAEKIGIKVKAVRGLRNIQGLYNDFKKENLPRLLITVFLVILIISSLVLIVERSESDKTISSFLESIWWGIVTVTTVGYGDFSPVSPAGRILAAALMLLGVVLTAILSGTIASIYVDRKIREGKGLQEVIIKNHIVICGWNKTAAGILESLINMKADTKVPVVLINQIDPEEFDVLNMKYPGLAIKFVRGDFTNEQVLKRGSISRASSAIVIADNSGNNSLDNADERTILSVMAIKSINPDITTCAELMNEENEPHLRRANVDDILVNGEFSGFLLANATQAYGIPGVVREILSPAGKNNIRQVPIPSGLIGKNFRELSNKFMTSGMGIVIGLRSEEKKMSLDDMLSGDSSSIDAFIKRKFMEAEINIADEQQQDIDIQICPDPEYIIKDTDTAFIIGAGGQE